ncbi:Receptor-like protein kinase 2 [Forsythia ovata]|uniref:Receptor-like protein kinase 2 n=1 Tax=Forsythia ovata TaxID=205694 RepID=A0ABD1UTZ7_9LAMI
MLRISVYQISGNIPPSLGTCTNLKLLSLLDNNFAGSIPMEIGNLSKLQILYLGRNNLIVGGNKISGKFPEDPCNRPTMLEILDLGDNKFQGEIPPSLFQCHALQILNISSNEFRGT